jgi:WD40 repeat protein
LIKDTIAERGAAASARRKPNKLNVFISYSHQDIEFVDRLQVTLKSRGIDAFVDREQVQKGEEWWARIKQLITEADTIVFALSPGSLDSKVCKDEVEFAERLNKRFVPIVVRDLQGRTALAALARLNYIFFISNPTAGASDGFDMAVDDLVRALETNIPWIREHTRLGALAQRWEGRKRPNELLLRGAEISAAETWLTTRPERAPDPTDSHRALITLSRRAATRRQRLTLAGSLGATVVAFGLAGLAYWQRGVAFEQRKAAEAQALIAFGARKLAEEQRTSAEEQRQLAEEQRDTAERRRVGVLAALAMSERLQGNFDTAMRLAVHAVRLASALDKDGTEISRPSIALANAVFESNTRLALIGHEASVNCAAFSPDGKRIVTASDDKTVRIWDTATGKEIIVLRGHDASVNSAAFSPDGKRIVTASDDKTARIWDAATGKEIIVLRGHEASVNSAAFSPEGRRVVTSARGAPTEDSDSNVRIWDATTGQQIKVLDGGEGDVAFATFTLDGKRVLAGESLAVRIWDAATGRQLALVPMERHIAPSTTAAWKNLNHVSIPDGIEQGLVRSLALSPDGKRFVIVQDIAIVGDATFRRQTVLHGHDDAATSAAFSPDGKRIVTASDDKTARIWDAATGKEIIVLRGHKASVRSAAFSPDGKRIVTASADNIARIWDTATESKNIVLRGHQGIVWSAAFSPDGQRIVTASDDKTARIWNAATGKEIIVLRGHKASVTSAAFSSDGGRVVTGALGAHGEDDSTRIWNATTGREIVALPGGHFSFTADGARIATQTLTTHNARIWDAKTGAEIATSVDDTARISDAMTKEEADVHFEHDVLSLSPDRTRAVGTRKYDDIAARIWDAATGSEIAILRGHEGALNSAAFSSDGSRVVTTSDDNTARIWDVHFLTMSTNDLIHEVCTRRLRGMTRLSPDEMSLAGYPDTMPATAVPEDMPAVPEDVPAIQAIDVCEGVQ